MKKEETLTTLMHSFKNRYDLRKVFDDFLTLSICVLTQNRQTGKSYYEYLYLSTLAAYGNDPLRLLFPKMFRCLIAETNKRFQDGSGADVLGEFYNENFSHKRTRQFCTQWKICKFRSESTSPKMSKVHANGSARVLDPSCGKGRMLCLAPKTFEPRDQYYKVGIDAMCLKMSVLNMFLSRIYHSKVLCADGYIPGDLKGSYRISPKPLDIFKIEIKEHSALWLLLKDILKIPAPRNDLLLPSQMRKSPIVGAQAAL